MIKYLVMPGNMPSKNDGDIHYISAQKLISLYGVNKNECVIAGERSSSYNNKLIILSPRYDGDYTLENEHHD